MAEKLCELKNMGGIRTNEKYESQIWKNVAADGIPTFTTQGKAKAIWAVRVIPNAGAIRAVTYTNVNPSTGQITDSMYYYDSRSPSTPAEYPNNKFIVTDNQITLQASLSTSAAYMMQLNYTY